MKITNPIMLCMALLNVGAGFWYLHNANPKLAIICFLYCVSSIILATM